MDIHNFYQQRISKFHSKEKECLKKEQKYPFYRLFVVVVGIVSFILLFQINILLSVLALLLFFSLFLVLIKVDFRNSVKKKEFQLLKLLNENEVKYLAGVNDFFNDGSKYQNDNHPYSGDFDVFGNSSLFQSINRTTLSRSSDVLSDWLLFPADTQEIQDRNVAVKELSEKIEWRQQVFISGYSLQKTDSSLNSLINWVKKSEKMSFKSWFIGFCYILSAITLISIALSFVFPIGNIVILLIAVQILIVWRSSKLVKKSHNEVSNNSAILETYSDIIGKIENENFSSKKIKALKDLLKTGSVPASKEIKKLSGIVNNLDVRFNVMLHPFLNTLLFWDIHQVHKLERWKAANKNIERWFHCVAEFEALSSFANMCFNNPTYCFPKIVENYFSFEANNLGHPLIVSDERVCNSLSIDGSAKILLISGSNMSGKSTFLRTIGINLVLAMAGSCVCATEFVFSPVSVLSSMRISDSLKDKTSSFFAELKKLETIIKVVERKERVFLLLDEILRGTNSTDRHIGSSALIKQLILNEAVGLVATHDLSLTEMVNDYPANLENYNFNIKINNEDLYFDYLLNKGVCSSLNASILMKKMGINI